VAYPWPKTIQTAIERKSALSGELKKKRTVVDDPRKEVNSEVTKTVGEFFVAAELEVRLVKNLQRKASRPRPAGSPLYHSQ